MEPDIAYSWKRESGEEGEQTPQALSCLIWNDLQEQVCGLYFPFHLNLLSCACKTEFELMNSCKKWSLSLSLFDKISFQFWTENWGLKENVWNVTWISLYLRTMPTFIQAAILQEFNSRSNKTETRPDWNYSSEATNILLKVLPLTFLERKKFVCEGRHTRWN